MRSGEGKDIVPFFIIPLSRNKLGPSRFCLLYKVMKFT